MPGSMHRAVESPGDLAIADRLGSIDLGSPFLAHVLVVVSDRVLTSHIRRALIPTGHQFFCVTDANDGIRKYSCLIEPVVLIQTDSSSYDALSAIMEFRRLSTRPKLIAVSLSPAARRLRILQAFGVTVVEENGGPSASFAARLVTAIEALLGYPSR
jgi:PleD family two-component response regulator